MADPNPYESPRSPKPSVPPKLIKRGIGLGFILLLTPIPTLITFFASCSAAVLIGMDSVGLGVGLSDAAAGAIAYGPPALVLAGMLGWAAWAWHQLRRRA